MYIPCISASSFPPSKPGATPLSFKRQTFDEAIRVVFDYSMFPKGWRTTPRRKDTMLNYTNAGTRLAPEISRNLDRVIPERCVSFVEKLHLDSNSRWTNYGGSLKFAGERGERLSDSQVHPSLGNVPSGKKLRRPSEWNTRILGDECVRRVSRLLSTPRRQK